MSPHRLLTHNRRMFLRGALGAVVALPLLEAFTTRRAQAGDGEPDTFAIFCRQGNGVQQRTDDEPERFWPSFAPGPMTASQLLADTGRTLSELGDHAERLIVIKGVHFALSGNGCPHAGGGNQCLTGAGITGDLIENQSLAEGESIDNRIQRELGKPGVDPLTLYAGGKFGYLDEVLSYRGPRDLRAAEGNPYHVYQKLFGLSTADPDALERLRLRRASVNDLVREEMKALLGRRDLSTADRDRLDLHFSSIRDLELGIACGLSGGKVADLEAVAANAADDDHFETVVRLQMDILTLAISCGAVRAATLQFGCGNEIVRFTIDGVKQKTYHKISHRIDSDTDEGTPIPDADILHHRIDRIHARLFKYLLDSLDAVKVGSGSLLDAGVAVWLNDLADKRHAFENVPYILAGGCKGALRTGQYVDLGKVMNNRVLSTIGAAVGCKSSRGEPLEDFGDPGLPGGVLSQLLA